MNSARAIGNRIYGCDDCLAVCPWNKFASAAQANRAFLPRAELAAPRLAELLALDDAGFRRLFSGSPIKRIGRRPVRPQLPDRGGQQRRRGAAAEGRALRDDPDPVVAEAAEWATKHLTVAPAKAGAHLRARPDAALHRRGRLI